MVHVRLGHSARGPQLQQGIHDLKAALGRVRRRLWRAAPGSTDALWDAANKALASATRPSDGSRTSCLQCSWVGPCLSTRPSCPRDHQHRFPVELHTPDILVTLRSSFVAQLPKMASLVQPLPHVLWRSHISSWSCGPRPLSNDSQPTSLCPRPSGMVPSYSPSSPHPVTPQCVRQGALACCSCPSYPDCPWRNDSHSKPSFTVGCP